VQHASARGRRHRDDDLVDPFRAHHSGEVLESAQHAARSESGVCLPGIVVEEPAEVVVARLLDQLAPEMLADLAEADDQDAALGPKPKTKMRRWAAGGPRPARR